MNKRGYDFGKTIITILVVFVLVAFIVAAVKDIFIEKDDVQLSAAKQNNGESIEQCAELADSLYPGGPQNPPPVPDWYDSPDPSVDDEVAWGECWHNSYFCAFYICGQGTGALWPPGGANARQACNLANYWCGASTEYEQ